MIALRLPGNSAPTYLLTENLHSREDLSYGWFVWWRASGAR